MLMSVYSVHALRVHYTYNVGSVLLVRVKGNTRASIRGTTTLQPAFTELLFEKLNTINK